MASTPILTLSHFCPTAAWMLFRADVARLDVFPDTAVLVRGLTGVEQGPTRAFLDALGLERAG